MDYPCSICFKNVANLSIAELENHSHTEEDWFCMNCISHLFPFSQIADEEFIYLSMGIDDNLIDLFDNCSDLNYEPFKHAVSKDYFVTDNIDPDNNLHNTLSVSSLYYTDDQFKHTF